MGRWWDQKWLFAFSGLLLALFSFSSCLNVDNTIQGHMGNGAAPSIALKVAGPNSLTFVNGQYQIDITGGAPPYSAVVMEGDASFDLASRIVQFGSMSSRVLLRIVDSLGISTQLELSPLPIEFGSEDPYSWAFQLSAGNQYLIYETSPAGSSSGEVYSQNLSTREIIKLSQLADTSHTLFGSQLTSDKSRIIYAANSTTDGTAIYSVFPDGSDHRRISAPILGSSMIPFYSNFYVSPDSSKVAFVADGDGNGFNDLILAPVLGGTNITLSDRQVSTPVTSPQFTSDSQFIVYMARKDTMTPFDFLYSSSLIAQGSVQLHPDLVFSGNINFFSVVPGTQKVIYVADQDDWDNTELFLATANVAASSVKLHSNLSGTNKNVRPLFEISNNASYVVFIADLLTEGVFEYFSVDISGVPGLPVRLNPPFASTELGPCCFVTISPDSSKVLYRADVDLNGETELYTVPIGGGGAVKLTPDPVAGGGFKYPALFTPDSSRVLFVGDFHTDEKRELYSIPAAGGTLVRLSGTDMIDNGDVHAFEISPDSSHVSFVADREQDGKAPCWVTNPSGTMPPKVAYLTSSSDVSISKCDFGRVSNELFIVGNLVNSTLDRAFFVNY